MRSSVRVDDNSHDLSWVQGATPRTLPPPMPLHPRTVLSMRGTAAGSWRGATWSPPSHAIVQHPPRRQVEPTIVIYKTLASQQSREVLPDGLHLTIHPAGDWIATTRFELGFARTPRYWLVVIDQAPPPDAERLRLTTGDSFWLEWRGKERVWQRRPRFQDDIRVLGGFAAIPGDVPPRPPTPPQRRDPTVPKPRDSYQGGFDPRRFVDTRPLRGRLIPAQAAPDRQAEAQLTQQADVAQPQPGQPARQPHNRGTPPTTIGKAKPPQPPPVSSGSETETSWPSEDPAPPEGEDTGFLAARDGTQAINNDTDDYNPRTTQRPLVLHATTTDGVWHAKPTTTSPGTSR